MLFILLLLGTSLSTQVEDCRGLLIRMNPDDLWNHADTVLIGVVTDITIRDADGMIYRDVSVSVEMYRKNPLNRSEIAILVMGGTIGEFGVWVEDQPNFNRHERVLVYLERVGDDGRPTRLERYRVVGGPQGKFTMTAGIARNEVGDTLFIDPFGLETMSTEIKMISTSSIILVAVMMVYFRKKT